MINYYCVNKDLLINSRGETEETAIKGCKSLAGSLNNMREDKLKEITVDLYSCEDESEVRLYIDSTVKLFKDDELSEIIPYKTVTINLNEQTKKPSSILSRIRKTIP